MSWVSIVAIYFVIWWLVLFVTLPLGVKSQIEDENITLGTDHGAPVKPWLWRKVLLTSLIAALIFGALYTAITVFHVKFDDLPRIVPSYQ